MMRHLLDLQGTWRGQAADLVPVGGHRLAGHPGTGPREPRGDPARAGPRRAPVRRRGVGHRGDVRPLTIAGRSRRPAVTRRGGSVIGRTVALRAYASQTLGAGSARPRSRPSAATSRPREAHLARMRERTLALTSRAATRSAASTSPRPCGGGPPRSSTTRRPRSSSAARTTTTAPAGTSGAGTSPTPTATPSSSTGGRTCPAPSTGRAGPSRSAWSGGAASASSRGA